MRPKSPKSILITSKALSIITMTEVKPVIKK